MAWINFYSDRTGIVTGGTDQGGIRRQTGTAGPEFFNASDIRFKENVVDYEEGYDIVKNLRTVEYNWIGDTQGEKGIGFIAQEVQARLPKHIKTKKKMKKKKVNKKDKDGNNIKVEEDTEELDYEYLTMGSSFQPIVLWSALRKAIEKIEVLEAKVLALEGN